MKQKDLNVISNFLRKIKINKIKNRETKIALINIHLALYKKVEEWQSDLEELQKKFFEGKEQELALYNQKVQEIQSTPADQQSALVAQLNPEMKSLVSEFNSIVEGMLMREVPVEFEKVNEQDFIEALIDLDIEFTCDDLIVLKDLYK